MSLLVREMWRSPTDEGGESGSLGARAWWEEEQGATFVQASALPVAMLLVLLYGRSTYRGSVYLGHT